MPHLLNVTNSFLLGRYGNRKALNNRGVSIGETVCCSMKRKIKCLFREWIHLLLGSRSPYKCSVIYFLPVVSFPETPSRTAFAIAESSFIFTCRSFWPSITYGSLGLLPLLIVCFIKRVSSETLKTRTPNLFFSQISFVILCNFHIVTERWSF